MLEWNILHPRGAELLGYIPQIILGLDPQPAKAQINDRYAHGGGWHPLKGWKIDIATGRASYPGDPSISPVASAKLRDETIYVYPHAWVAIVQADGTYEMARMD